MVGYSLWGHKVSDITERLHSFLEFGSEGKEMNPVTFEKGDCSHEIKRRLLLGRKVMTTRQHIKKQRHYFANKGPFSESYGFANSHVRILELDYKES